MRATVDPTRCTGCGICEIICPEVFRMKKDGRKEFTEIHSNTVPEEAMSFCVDARDCCKPKAIQILKGQSCDTGFNRAHERC